MASIYGFLHNKLCEVNSWAWVWYWVYHIAWNLSRVKTFASFAVLGQFAIVLALKMFFEYDGVIINWRVDILNTGDSVGIVDVASLSLARQNLSNSSFPNCHVDIVASINSRSPLCSSLAYSSCSRQFNLVRRCTEVSIAKIRPSALRKNFQPREIPAIR